MKVPSLLASFLLVLPTVAMANTLPVEKIRDLAVQAGFSPKDAGTMAAICKSESGGFTGAHNSKYPDDSYGLCQINMLDEPGYMLGAERRQKFGIGSNEALKDPLTNLKAAKQVFDSQGFGAWSDYKNEKYLEHLPAPQMPETKYDPRSSNGSSNLDEAKSGSEEQKTREVLAKLSDDRKEAVRIFEEAVKNVMPTKEVRSRRIGGATYQVPYPLKFDRSEALALRWIVRAARGKEGTDMIL